MLEVGKKVRGDEVVFVSADHRVWAAYGRDRLGAKGIIWGKMLVQNPTPEEREEYWDHAIQIIELDGVWYKVLEYVQDYPEIFRRCRFYTEDKRSAYYAE